MQAERDAFLGGCRERGIDGQAANEIFEEMLGFAKYAFNKSHATAYGILAYRTAYLKAHYPAEYFAALLTSVLDSQTKVREYITDASKFGVEVLSPDINESYEHFSTDGKNIRFGLLAIRNVGRPLAAAIIRERERSPYKSFDSFVSRMVNSDLNKRSLEYMIKCGAFDALGITRSSLLQCYESILDSEHERLRNNISGQMDFFSIASSGHSGVIAYSYPIIEEFSLKELLLLEKESSGMYFSGHLIDDYTSHLSSLKTDKISDITESAGEDSGESSYSDRAGVSVAGIISDVRTKITKSGDTMARMTLEDRYGEIEVLVFAKQYRRYSELIRADGAIFVSGTLSLEENEPPRIMLSSLTPLIPNSEYKMDNSEKKLYIKVPNLGDPRINNIIRTATLNPGEVKVILFDGSTRKYSVMSGVRINPDDRVLARLSSTFSPENVVLK
jgi:DNA polymerase-3 subunit alpha